MIAVDGPERPAELAAALSGQGHEITLHTRRTSPGRPRKTQGSGVVVDRLPAGPERPLNDAELLTHLGEFGRRLATRWAIHPPDVLHAHGWQSGIAALAGSDRILLVQSHGPLACRDPGRRAQAELEYALSRTAAASTVVCDQDADDLIRMGVPRPRIEVMPAGVDVAAFSRRGPASPRGEFPRLLVLTGPGAGAETAMRALSRVPDVQLVIAGGPEPTSLETDSAATRLRLLAKEEAVDERVLILGRVPERRIPRLIRSADLVLALEPGDPFALDVLQAMACGVPTVAVRSRVHLNVVLDDVTGILVTDTAPSVLAGLLRVLLADPTSLQILGLASEDRARTRHSWTRVATETQRLYQRITATGG